MGLFDVMEFAAKSAGMFSRLSKSGNQDSQWDTKTKERVSALEKLANEGDSDAMFELGCLFLGKYGGVVVDPERAAKWFERAANLGDPTSMFNLGLIYLGDNYFEMRNNSKSSHWLEMAMQYGYPDAEKVLRSNFRYSAFSGTWKRIYK